MNYYSGTSGLLVPFPKRDFPEAFADKSRLTFYSHLFNSIEINSSFYKLPQAKTIAKWAGEVGENFRFTFKLWREITHQKGLVFAKQNVHQFIDVINCAGNKRGCLLIQFPPGLRADAVGQLIKLLSCIKDADRDNLWPLAVEFRHRSWYTDNIYQILSDLGAGLVYHDIPASATPIIHPIGNMVYVRFHGPAGGYRGSYPDDYLCEYAGYIHEWLADNHQVYVYFNNTAGDALNNLQALNRMIQTMK